MVSKIAASALIGALVGRTLRLLRQYGMSTRICVFKSLSSDSDKH
jgi:hypothetical protein